MVVAALCALVACAEVSSEAVVADQHDGVLLEPRIDAAASRRRIGGGCTTGYGLEFRGGEIDKYFAQTCSKCVEHCCQDQSLAAKGSDAWMYYFGGRQEHQCTCHQYVNVTLKTHPSNLFYHPDMRSNRCPQIEAQVFV